MNTSNRKEKHKQPNGESKTDQAMRQNSIDQGEIDNK